MAKRKRPKLYAFSVLENGGAGCVGEVVSESRDSVRIECVDTFMAWAAGMWDLSGELVDIPRAKCRLFNDREACFQTAIEACEVARKRCS